MSEAIITAEGLSKRYLVAHNAENQGHRHYHALRDVIGREIRNIARKSLDMMRGRQVLQGDEIEEFWALRDVNFEIKRGEVVGIIGRNGAGKSTLLKILSRITDPTEGRVMLRGRVGSLLEVGTGFSAELTGRENIYLNGAILGMTRREIAKKFDEIVAFAEVERFLDTPVKRYSSGMYVRLGFAVAAHLEPDILIVDEVLAVGDTDFQQKCLGKMNDVSRREGRTVLFVSHNMGVIHKLCPTSIWLDHGRMRRFGETGEVIRDYLAQSGPNRAQIVELAHLPRQWVEGSELRLKSLEWLCDLPLKHGEPVRARIVFETHVPITNFAVGIGFCDPTGRRLLSYDTDLTDGYRPNLPETGVYAVELAIGALPLQPATYLLDVGCRSVDTLIDYIPSAVWLEVIAGVRTPGFALQATPGVRLESQCAWQLGNLRNGTASTAERLPIFSSPP
jgi:lipopolysaccharide transport system ATP-binding protein